MSAADFGTDVYSVDDVDETRMVAGVACVAQDAFWALQTPQGMGILEADAPHYGMDLLDEIGSATTPSDVAALPDKIRNTLKKDERIESVTSTITATAEGPATTYDIRIVCTTAEGPFELVGTAASDSLELAVRLLQASA